MLAVFRNRPLSIRIIRYRNSFFISEDDQSDVAQPAFYDTRGSYAGLMLGKLLSSHNGKVLSHIKFSS